MLPLALAAASLFAPTEAAAQTRSRAPRVAPAPAPAASASGPVELQADRISGRPDLDAVAEGAVELKRGPLQLQSDWLSYEQAQDLAIARGHVRIRNANGRYSGPELQLRLQTYEGFFLEPIYEFEQLGSGGRAARIDFLGEQRAVASAAWYTSCPRDDGDRPAWVLKADRVQLDFDANVGVAEGTVLRFMDVPILALPTLSFPLGDERKSGWLPPTFDFDTRSGLSVAIPYYVNLAENRDATLTPRVITRRGMQLSGEFRYLENDFRGRVQADTLPGDRVAGRSRWAVYGEHEGRLPFDGRWHAEGLRVSDDAWWKDFPKDGRSLNARLLPASLDVEHELRLPGVTGTAYARALRWQVLQGSDVAVVSPYERAPQLGVQLQARPAGGLRFALQAEANRFTLPDRDGSSAEPTGWRTHVLGTLSLPWRQGGLWLEPRLRVNAASYALDQALSDGRRHASRVIPTFGVDGGMSFERDTTWFGHALRQTLEPRVQYLNTPFRDQSALPNFDSAGRDANVHSIFADNAFTGVDRVSDAHQVTAGVTTRLLDATSGAEALRLAVVQRYRLRTQRITPDGAEATQRFSDLYLLGAGSLGAGFAVDGSVQYSPDLQRTVSSTASGRWNPGEFRTLSATYRFTRGLNEQVELGWQWPLWKSAAAARPAAGGGSGGSGSAGSCSGTWYTVGRINYSMKDRRVTDSVLGLEYDAGCWILRVVGERLSTGRSEATTHIQVQLELVGLSRLGSNPLKVLKDNIPGYRLLRDDAATTTSPPPRYD